jgi:hypothetical protein
VDRGSWLVHEFCLNVLPSRQDALQFVVCQQLRGRLIASTEAAARTCLRGRGRLFRLPVSRRALAGAGAVLAAAVPAAAICSVVVALSWVRSESFMGHLGLVGGGIR